MPAKLEQETIERIQAVVDYLEQWRLGKIKHFREDNVDYQVQLAMLPTYVGFIESKLKTLMPREASQIGSRLDKLLKKAKEVDGLNRTQKGSEIVQSAEYEMFNLATDLGSSLRSIVESTESRGDSTLDCLSATELAKRFGIENRNALRKRLDRYRKKHALDNDAFFEIEEAARYQPKYLYPLDKVTDICEQMQNKKTPNGRSSETKC